MTEIQNTPLPVDERTLLRVLTWLHAGWHLWAYQWKITGPGRPQKERSSAMPRQRAAAAAVT